MNDATFSPTSSKIHAHLSDLCARFRQLQNEMLNQPVVTQRDEILSVATTLIDLCDMKLDQVLGELFLSEHSKYNFVKPLYVAASLAELTVRYREYDDTANIDEDKRRLLVIAALGFNLGLLASEYHDYEDQQEYSPEDKKRLRESYPQKSAEIMAAAGFNEPLVQEILRNHGIGAENPSKEAMLMRTPFIYAGIALPQNLERARLSIANPSREFAQMFANQELDLVFGGLFLRINGMAPIGSILKLETNERALVLSGPTGEDIASSKVRMLANRNGVQLLRPGEFYALNSIPSRLRGLSDHHQFAWTNFSAYMMWGD